MGKRPSVQYQLCQVIDSSFCPGASRHKDVDYHGQRIVSYADRDALRDTAFDFGKFCRANGIKWIKDITPEVANKWIEQKANSGCKLSTLKAYASRLDKLGRLTHDVLGYDVNFKADKDKLKERQTADEKIRTVKMERDDLNRALDGMKGKSQSKIAIQLSAAFGLRVSETVKIKAEHIDMQKGILHIIGAKGGRDRDIMIRTDAQRDVLKELLSRDKGKGEYLLTVKADSVNKALSRAFEKLDITTYKDHKTGLHSIRKLYATERYNELRDRGMSHKTAWGHVSEELGHGRDREDLFKVYVVK